MEVTFDNKNNIINSGIFAKAMVINYEILLNSFVKVKNQQLGSLVS